MGNIDAANKLQREIQLMEMSKATRHGITNIPITTQVPTTPGTPPVLPPVTPPVVVQPPISEGGTWPTATEWYANQAAQANYLRGLAREWLANNISTQAADEWFWAANQIDAMTAAFKKYNVLPSTKSTDPNYILAGAELVAWTKANPNPADSYVPPQSQVTTPTLTVVDTTYSASLSSKNTSLPSGFQLG
jgi:hypothetical protein